MGKMHPDDVNARDWDFMLSERFPEVPRVDALGEWAGRGMSWLSEERLGFVKAARANLANAWPNALEGETLEPFIARLEAALDGKRPAVSTSIRGELENQTSAARKAREDEGVRWEGGAKADRALEAADKVLHPYGTDPDGLITQVRVEYEAKLRVSGLPFPSLESRLRAAEKEARRRWPKHFTTPQPSKQAKLDTLKLRLRRSCDRFGALDIQVEPVVRGDQLGIKLLSSSDKWQFLPGTVMTLTESELWLDHFEETCHTDVIKDAEDEYRAQAAKTEKAVMAAFGVPSHMFKRR